MALRPSVEGDGLGHNTVMSCCHWHWVLSLVEDMPLGRWPWRWAAEAPRRSTSRRPEHLRLRQGWRLVVGLALGPRWKRHRQQRHVGRGGQGAPLAGGAGHLGGHAAWTVGAEMGLGPGPGGVEVVPRRDQLQLRHDGMPGGPAQLPFALVEVWGIALSLLAAATAQRCLDAVSCTAAIRACAEGVEGVRLS